MKKFLLLPLLVISLFAFGQGTPFPNYQQFGSATTLTDFKGAARTIKGFVNGTYTDTTEANLGSIDFYPGSQIFTTSDNRLWLRNSTATRWTVMGSGITISTVTFLTDSSMIICYSDGVCDTISFNNNNVFMTVNNTFGGCNNLLSGGVVTANNPTVTLVFDVTAANYTIGCKTYSTVASQVTLANGHATLGRFDVVIVDTNEVVSVLQGTPSSDPQVPQINHASQLALTTFLVPAGATTATQLGITRKLVYDENTGPAAEFTSASSGWTVDFGNTSFPANGSIDALLSGSTISTSQISWTTTDTMRNGQFDVFKFYIRLTDAWVSGQGLDIAWYNGTTKVSNSVTFSNNSYGFNQATTGSYQVIAIPMANWVFTDSIFFKVIIKPLATPFSSQAFRLDWVQLQGGINQALGGSAGLYIWNQYSLAQPANWWINGNARLEGNLQSPQRISVNGTTFYTGSLKVGGFAIANGTEATVFGEYARANTAGAISIGSQAGLQGGSGITISQYGTTSSSTSVNIGGLTNSGTGNVNLGINSTITGNSNVSIGETAQLTGTRSINIGYNMVNARNNTIAMGYAESATRNNEFFLSSNIQSIEARGMTRGVAGYVLTDSLGTGEYLVLRPATGGTVTAANNGTSLSGTTVQLGQAVAAVGDPAILLSHREIPMGNFTLSLNASAAQSNNIFQTKNAAAAIRARITSAASFSNTGGQSSSEIFGDGASVGGANSTVFGSNASAGASTSVVVGYNATSGTGGNGIVIGSGASSGNGITGVVLIGTSSTHTTSGNATLIGTSITSTGRSTGIGYSGTYSSSNNVGIGEQVNIGHTYSIGLGFGATTTAANQLVMGADINSGTEGGLNDIYWGEGVLTVSPNNISLNANSGSGTNIAGGTLSYNASRGTGTGTPGVHIFQVSTALGSGTTLQTLTPRIQINGSGILAYNGVMPTSGAAGDSVVHRRTSDGQFYLKPVTGSTYTASELITLSGSDFQFGGTATTDRTATLGANTVLFTANTLAGDPAISITSTSTAAASNLQKGLNVSLSGANATGSQATYGIYSANTHTGATSSNYAGYFTASGATTNYGLYSIGTQYGVYAESGAGTAVSATSTSSYAFDGQTTSGTAMQLGTSPTGTNDVNTTIELLRQTSGTAAAGIGTQITYTLQMDDGDYQPSNKLISTWTNVTPATRTSSFSFWGINSGGGRTLMTLAGNGLVTLGVTGANTGLLAFAGVTSGLVTIQPASAAGTYTLTLPTDDGTPSQILTTDGSGVLSWTTAGAGNVTKVGTPVNNQLGVWTGDGTIEGDANLTFAASTLNIGVAGASTGILTVSGVTSGTITIQPASVAGTYTLTLPTTDGNASEFLQTNGAGVLTWAAGGGSSTWNGITDPTGAQALTFQATENSVWTDQNTTADNLTINSSTGTTNSLISLNRTGTALAAGNNIMELISSGANGTNAITATGLNISVTNTNATSGTNVGLSITASGATTENTALNVTAGQVRLPNGTSTVPSIYFPTNGVGIYYGSAIDGIGIHAGTIGRLQIGSNGLIFREATAVLDFGNSGTMGGTNRFRLSATAVGTMQLGMETTQQSMIFKGANNAGTNAVAFSLTLQSGAGTGTGATGGEIFLSTSDATGSGTTVQSYTPKLTITKDGRVYGSALHNNAGAVTGTTNQYIASGTYTPTLTNVTNVTASTAYECQWYRVGNVVTVSGKVDIDVTLGAASELGLSLPIASGFTAEENCGGNASSDAAASLVARVKADATNDRASFVFVAVSLTNDAYNFEFTYLIK